ncbi:MAG: DUF6680 family protein, partial [Candidatus Binatia bacterium]
MRTRRMYMVPDHVHALNLVQLEFFHDDAVNEAFKGYISNLSEVVPAPGAELDAFMDKRRSKFFDLLFEMSKVMNCEISKEDLEKYGYVPNGWLSEQADSQTFQKMIIELLQGRRPIPITNFNPLASHNPFPPAP